MAGIDPQAIAILRKLPARFRLKLLTEPDVSPWGVIVANSPENVIELPEAGPVLIREIEWLEIDPIERKRLGQLVPDQIIDHTTSAEQTLKSMKLTYSREVKLLRIWGQGRNDEDPTLA